MSSFKLDDDVEIGKDSLGGGGGFQRDSGVYEMLIAAAYMDVSAGGATSLNLVLKDAEGEMNFPLWTRSKDSKGNLIYYMAGKKKIALPGLKMAQALAQLTVGIPLDQFDDAVMKKFNIWDKEAGQKQPKDKLAVLQLIGQTAKFGILKCKADVNVKNDEGKYVPSGEYREENEIDQIFQVDTNLNLVELIAAETEGKFIDKWKEKWEGEIKDKTKKVKGAPKAAPTPPAGLNNSDVDIFDD